MSDSLPFCFQPTGFSESSTVAMQISDEEEQLQNARLRVRRGMPIRSLDEFKARQDRAQQSPQQQDYPVRYRCCVLTA